MRVHHRYKPSLQFSVGVFRCILAHNVKYNFYCDQGHESQEATNRVQLPHLTKVGIEWRKKNNLGPEKFNDSLELTDQKWQSLK